MSRVAKNPIPVPAGVEVSLNAASITVKGPQGTLSQGLHRLVAVQHTDGNLQVVPADESTAANALSGTTRAILANMVQRDQTDSSRKVAPLVAAADAVKVVTDGKSKDEVVEEIYQLALQRG